MDSLSLLAFLFLLSLMALGLILGRSKASGQGRRQNYQRKTSQDDNLPLLHPLILPDQSTTHYVPPDDYSHTTVGHHDSGNTDFGSSWDSGSNVDTSSTGFDSGGGDLGGTFGSEIGGGSDFGGGGAGGSDGSSF